VVDPLARGVVVRWLAVGEALRGRDVGLDGDDRELVVTRDLIAAVVPIGEETDTAGHHEEERREDRRGTSLPP